MEPEPWIMQLSDEALYKKFIKSTDPTVQCMLVEEAWRRQKTHLKSGLPGREHKYKVKSKPLNSHLLNGYRSRDEEEYVCHASRDIVNSGDIDPYGTTGG